MLEPMSNILPWLAAESAGPSVFAGSIAQSVAAVVVFLILFAVLYKLAWNPILKGLQEREQKIRADLEKAEESARQAEATLREYQRQLADARDQAARIIDAGRREAERLAQQLQDETRKELDELKAKAQADIRFAKEQALAEIYTQTAGLATQIAGRILQREVKVEDQQRLIAEALGAVKKQDLN